MVTWPFWRLSVSQLIFLCFVGLGECSEKSGDGRVHGPQEKLTLRLRCHP